MFGKRIENVLYDTFIEEMEWIFFPQPQRQSVYVILSRLFFNHLSSSTVFWNSLLSIYRVEIIAIQIRHPLAHSQAGPTSRRRTTERIRKTEIHFIQ